MILKKSRSARARTSPAPPAAANSASWQLWASEEFNRPMQVLDPVRGYVAFRPGGPAWRTCYPPQQSIDDPTDLAGRFDARLANIYTTDAVSVREGSCRLTTTRMPEPAALNPIYPVRYTAGMIAGLEHHKRAYGYFEARMRLPGDAISWPAFWLFRDARDPLYTELDIMECFSESGNVGATNWSSPTADYRDANNSVHLVFTPVWVRDWVRYAIEWTPDTVRWFVNDKIVATETNGGASKPSQAMYPILNNAIIKLNDKKDYPTAESGPVDIDWVRIWEPQSS